MTDTKIRAKVREGAPENATFPDSDGWTVTLRRGARCMTVPFYMGYGNAGREPTAAEVLHCLCADAAGADNATSFEEWCGEYGYDTDSRSAEKTYRAVERIAAKLKQFLGDDYARLVFSDEETIAAACA